MLLAMWLQWIALAQQVSRDVALGRKLAEEVERQSTLVTDPVIVDYLNRIGQKVAQPPLTIKVLADEGPHAQAFPGGFCYLNSGLILAAANEAELAGAIAHQLGHLELGDDQFAPLATGQIPLVWSGGCLRGRARVGLAIPPAYLSRQAELESRADRLGLGYLEKAGYDPGALADLYERILAQGKPNVASVFQASFPASTRTDADVLRSQRSNYLVTTSEFREVQRRLEALPPAKPRPAAGPSLLRLPH
jgi:beta-barrel assembly-enhancing protease